MTAAPSARVEVAFHEAGHAVACMLHGVAIERAALTATGGVVTMKDPPVERPHEHLKVCVAGAVAEALHTKRPVDWSRLSGGGDTMGVRTAIARLAGLPEYTRRTLLSRAVRECTAELREHWGAVTAVATALIGEHELTGDRVAALFHQTSGRAASGVPSPGLIPLERVARADPAAALPPAPRIAGRTVVGPSSAARLRPTEAAPAPEARPQWRVRFRDGSERIIATHPEDRPCVLGGHTLVVGPDFEAPYSVVQSVERHRPEPAPAA